MIRAGVFLLLAAWTPLWAQSPATVRPHGHSNVMMPELEYLQTTPPPYQGGEVPGWQIVKLWELLDLGDEAALDARIEELQVFYPGWQAPPELLKVRRERAVARAEKRLWNLVEAGDFNALDEAVAALHQHYPDWQMPPQLPLLREEQDLWALLKAERFAQLEAQLSRLQQRYPDWQAPPTLQQNMQSGQRAAKIADLEKPLWALLRQQHYVALNRQIAALQRAYPNWRAPPKLLRLKRQGEQSQRISVAIAAQDWAQVRTLAERYPHQFSCVRPDFYWALAEAQANDARARNALYTDMVQTCQDEAVRLNTLYKARAHLNAADFLALIEQAEARASATRAALQDLAYQVRLADFHAAPDTLSPELIDAILTRRDGDSALALAWFYIEKNQPEPAQTWFEYSLAWGGDSDSVYYGLALIASAAKNWNQATNLLRQTNLSEAAPLRADVSLALAQQAYDAGDYALAREELKQVPHSRAAALLHAWLTYQEGDYAEAAVLFRALWQADADHASAQGWILSLEQQGQAALSALAQEMPLTGELGAAWQAAMARRYFHARLFVAAQAIAEGAFAELDNFHTSVFAVGAGLRQRSGNAGLSQLRTETLPLLHGRWLHRQHIWQGGVKRLNLDSGILAEDAWIGDLSSPAQAWETRLRGGLEPYLSYMREDWLNLYADLGLTPENSAVGAQVFGKAGLSRLHDSGRWQAEVFVEPVRESLLSYTGLRDPGTGRVWGGVRRYGARLSGYRRLTDSPWLVNGNLESAWYTGTDVAHNRALRVRLGLDNDLARPGFTYVTAGPFVEGMRFAENLSHFTWGHGGYFSPQKYLSLGVALALQTREHYRHLWQAYVQAGYTRLQEDAAPCFPRLDAQAACAYDAYTQQGVFVSGHVRAIKQLTSFLALSGGLELRHSPDYNEYAVHLNLHWQAKPRSSLVSHDLF
jgi:cellulose synthase operon protein C